MRKICLTDFIEERIKENRDLFTKEELMLINENRKCVNKVYLLGAINSKDCYDKEHFLNDKRENHDWYKFE